MEKPFKIYRSSAGSGKTYTLAREYLKLALRSPDSYRHILAVTFTNKATQEMKERIIEYLHQFSQGEMNSMAAELMDHLDLPQDEFSRRCEITLSYILHGYSQFAVSTIDKFFQKVIRAFTREAGLYGGFNIQLDTELVLETVVDELMDEVGNNHNLRQWLLEFSEFRIEKGDRWDVRKSIIDLGKELFKESFIRLNKEDSLKQLEDKSLNLVKNEMYSIQKQFLEFRKNLGTRAIKLIEENGLAVDDFSGGKVRSIANYFKKLVDYIDDPPTKTFRDGLEAESKWYTQKSTRKDDIIKVLNDGLLKIARDVVNHYDEFIISYNTALAVQNNFYAYGILSDLNSQIERYKEDQNEMLISDMAPFLNKIIDDNDSPFIYEKVGSFYNHFLIDEFQDTSDFQWQNFKPLINNSLASGNLNLVVGDVKQSIYRWRGGDWQLLQNKIHQDVFPDFIRIHNLGFNYRSKKALIKFNNAIFEKAGIVLAGELKNAISSVEPEELKSRLSKKSEQIALAYQDVTQQTPDHLSDHGGFISFRYIKGISSSEQYIDEVTSQLPAIVENWLQLGYSLRDIVFLVKTKKEAKEIVDFFMNFKQSPMAKEGFTYDIISNEALYLNNSSSVSFLINVLQLLNNPEDQVSAVSVVYDYQYKILRNREVEVHDLMEAFQFNEIDRWLPEGFTSKQISLSRLPLFEMVERLIHLFDLGSMSEELGYIQAFQDHVLTFAGEEKGDLNSFLRYWEEHGHKHAVQLPENSDAMQVMTIHKSKGLQFKVVVLPFMTWKLDHDSKKNNLIWADSNRPPLDKLGHFPVKYKSSLAESDFREAYYDEKILAYMDNLNLLYVAQTRAEDALICYGRLDKENSGAISTVSQLTYKLLKEQDSFEYGAWVDDFTYEAGQPEPVPVESETKSVKDKEIKLGQYFSADWVERISINKRLSQLSDFLEGDQKEKINYGILMHDLMSRVQMKSQLPEALEEMISEGLVSVAESQQLKEKVNELFKMKKVNEWFTSDWEVKTEVPILPASGELSRLDRVLLKDDKAVIIDFKTGIKKKADENQVKRYHSLLRQMGYRDVRSFLLYVDPPEIVEIN